MPDFITPNEASYSVDKLEGGRGIYNTIFANMYKGLPENIKNMMLERGLSQVSGNTSAAKQAITEAGGDAPGSSQLSALSRVYAGAGSDITNLGRDIAFKDADLQQSNYDKAMAYYNSLIDNATARGQASNSFNLGKAQIQNQNALEQYKIDESNKFSWGDLAGSVLGAGGQVASAGITKCCFIFLESYRGELPAHVRIARDYYYDKYPSIAKGYKKMAKWLVPMMQKNKLVRFAVDKLMVAPITRYGGWKWNVEGYNNDWVFAPFKWIHFLIWGILGR